MNKLPQPEKPRILLSVNTSWNVINFRKELIHALMGHGFEVIVAAPLDAYSQQIRELGCKYIPLAIDSHGSAPTRDVVLLARYIKMMRDTKAAAYLSFTAKPNIYGSIAANIQGVPVINNIAGLGRSFIHNSWLTSLVKILYRVALRRSQVVFFQNQDDKDLFVRARLVHRHAAEVLPGSGIDIQSFRPSNPSPSHRNSRNTFRFLFVGRILWDKGIGEFIEAARLIKFDHPNCQFEVLGFTEPDNKISATPRDIEAWVNEGIIRYLGATDDVRPYIENTDCVVLPSYREGTPRSLLEAAAMAKPIIATNVPGCRQVVEDNVNGLLCASRNAIDLTEKMQKMMALSEEDRLSMGRAGRSKVVRAYSHQRVIDLYIDALSRILTLPQQRTETDRNDQVRSASGAYARSGEPI